MTIETDYGYLSNVTSLIAKHIENTYQFQDTSSLEEAEIQAQVNYLCSKGLPLPVKTLEWLDNIIKFVSDKQRWLVYDSDTGLWKYTNDDAPIHHIIVDYFEILKQFAYQAHDRVTAGYANRCSKPTARNNIISLLRDSRYITISKSAEIADRQFNIRCFETTKGEKYVINLNKKSFNFLKTDAEGIRPYTLTQQLTHPIEVDNYQEPTYFLSLIDEYMLHDPEKIEYFKKMLAYLMSPYNYNQCLIYWLGKKGRNGKSTMLKVLQDLLGSHVALLNSDLFDSKSTLVKSDDMLASAEGKSLLMFNEIDERMVASTKAIKDLTEGDRDESGNKRMRVIRPAYSRAYEVCICGTPLLVANNLINMGNWANLNPIYRRLVLVSFDYVIPKEDPNVYKRLHDEYPNIQMWLYRNYFKYKDIKLKDEPLPADWQEEKDNYDPMTSGGIECFLKDCVELGTDFNIKLPRSILYKSYVDYCKANGQIPIKNNGTNGFGELVKPYIKDRLTAIKGIVYIKGCKMNSNFEVIVTGREDI